MARGRIVSLMLRGRFINICWIIKYFRGGAGGRWDFRFWLFLRLVFRFFVPKTLLSIAVCELSVVVVLEFGFRCSSKILAGHPMRFFHESITRSVQLPLLSLYRLVYF